MDSFLVNDDFGKTLMTKKVGELPDFRVRCRQFINRLIAAIVGKVSVTSGVSRCFYSFCPDFLLEGDDDGVFALFADLCRLLKMCNLITSDESSCAVDEFGSYVIAKRRQHRSFGQSACHIIESLTQDFSIQSLSHVLHVFRLCCLAVRSPEVFCLSVSISLSGSSLREDAVQNCVRLIQSYVLSPGYIHQSFFTGQTLNAVRFAVDEAGVFFVCGEINLWKDFDGPSYDLFVSAQRDLCVTLLLQRRKELEVRLVVQERNQRRLVKSQKTQRLSKGRKLVVQNQKGARYHLTRTLCIKLVGLRKNDGTLMIF